MTEMIHGLVSGLIWAGILGSCLCLIAIAAVITATVRESGTVTDTAARTTRARDRSPIPKLARPAPTAILFSTASSNGVLPAMEGPKSLPERTSVALDA
jgi:hypothetical protein